MVAVNRYGKAAAVATAQVTVAAGEQVTFDVTAGSDTAFYEVYRTEAGGAVGTARLIFKVRANSSGTTTITDLNRFLPNTSKGYMLSQSSEVLKWKQLAPFTKIPLATIDSSIRWMQILYGALQVMAPKKNGIFINVGNLQTGAYGS